MEPICVVPTGDFCGEAATWDAAANCLYWTDINRFLLHAYNVTSNSTRTYIFEQPVVALSLTDHPEKLLVALGSELILFDLAKGASEGLPAKLPGWPGIRFNDGRTDPLQSFWIGSMGNNVGPNGEPLPVTDGKGTLYRYRTGNTLETIETGIGIPNTLCWSPDSKHFYFGDSLKNEIRVYDFNPENGDIGPGTSFFTGFERGLPDGSAMDSEGYLWNCRYGGGCVVRVSPDGGIDKVIEIPTENVTTCTFGGADLTTLYITTAALDRSPEDRLAGSLFAIDTGVRGMPENLFSLG